jgi:hypothetical protein
MWKKMSVGVTIVSILCGILGAICDAKEAKDKITEIKAKK